MQTCLRARSLPSTHAPQIIVVAPDSKYDMYWFSPATVQDPFTHDWYHMEVG